MPLTEAQGLVFVVVQLGFAAAMCIFVFVAYQKLVLRLADIIKDNTQAMTQLRDVIAYLCSRFDQAEREGQIHRDEEGRVIVEPRPATARRAFEDLGGV